MFNVTTSTEWIAAQVLSHGNALKGDRNIYHFRFDFENSGLSFM